MIAPVEIRACAFALVVGACSLGAQRTTAIAASDARFERLFNGGFFLESPAVAPDGSVYFSDLTYSSRSGMQAGHIWRYNPRTGATTIFRSPSGMSNGIIFDLKGDLIVAEGADFGGRRITRTDMRTGKSYILAGLYQGRPFNSPNDLTLDQRGRIYFTDPRYVGHEPIEQPVMGIYRIDPDTSVHLLAANVWKPNGIAVSPDQKTLYVVAIGDFNTNIIRPPPLVGGFSSGVHAYDLEPDGSLKYRKQIVAFPTTRWGDGMTVDTDGNVYIAVSSTVPAENGVYVFSPDGRQLAMLSTPEGAVNLEFGRGSASNVLYVACEHGLYRIQLLRSGYRPTL
ncbi:MAG: SMP-30/gluconolactonase/LRE family protein [Gemmatimonadales bacterium]|nr:SMP-30/gluconolactonase/LRE family protein [Gemmatimonadales bacterium]